MSDYEHPSLRPLKSFAMTGKELRVPTIGDTKYGVSPCTGCVFHYEKDLSRMGCNVKRCRYEDEAGKFHDFILINPVQLEKYTAAKVAFDLDPEAEEDRPGDPWDFR